MSIVFWVVVGLAALAFLAVIASVQPEQKVQRRRPRQPSVETLSARVEPGYDRTAADFPLERDGDAHDPALVDGQRSHPGRWAWDELER